MKNQFLTYKGGLERICLNHGNSKLKYGKKEKREGKEGRKNGDISCWFVAGAGKVPQQ